MSHVTCHMSHVMCHCHFYFCFMTKWWSLSVKGLLSFLISLPNQACWNKMTVIGTTKIFKKNSWPTYFWLIGLHWHLGSPARHLVTLSALNLAHSYVTVHFRMLPVLCFSRHVAQTAALRQLPAVGCYKSETWETWADMCNRASKSMCSRPFITNFVVGLLVFTSVNGLFTFSI